MADLVKHGELTIEQIADIKKNILVSLRDNDNFWDKFCGHDNVARGYSSLEWRKLNIPELKQTDLVNLQEGITPDSLKLTYVKFKIQPANYGNWIAYTDESKRYNYDDVVADAKARLAADAHDQAELRKGKQFVSGTCTMDLVSTGTNQYLRSMQNARIILRKNHAKPISGTRYGNILTPEHASDILIEYKDSITHTSQKESIIDGYLGELSGFVLFEHADDVMYIRTAAEPAVACVAALTTDTAIDPTKTYYTRAAKPAGSSAGYLNDGTYVYTAVPSPVVGDIGTYYEVSNKGKDAVEAGVYGQCLFIGKTDYGMPVKTVSFGSTSVEVIDKGLGAIPQVDETAGVISKVKPDALNQRGSIGYKVMGFATAIVADEAIVRAKYKLSAEIKLDIVDSDRQHFVKKESSPNI